jgi:hypothetical protein
MPTEKELLDLQAGTRPLIPEETKNTPEIIEETHIIINLFF